MFTPLEKRERLTAFNPGVRGDIYTMICIHLGKISTGNVTPENQFRRVNIAAYKGLIFLD